MTKAVKVPKSVRKSFTAKLLSAIFVVSCSLGFAYQVNALATIYFKYDTSTELTIETPSKLTVPDLTVCIRYVDIFDFKRYNSEHGTSFEDKVTQVDHENIDKLESLFRLDEIFNYTPPVEGLFSNCVVRRPGSFGVVMATNESCFAFFDIRKFFLQEYMCYQLTSIFKNHLYDHLIIAYALNYPSIFYRPTFDSELLQNSRVLKVIVHKSADYPSLSAGFAPVFQRQIKNNSIEGRGGYQMTYSTVDVYRLEPPYQTGCMDYKAKRNFSHASVCFNDCIVKKSLAVFNKITFASITGDAYPVKHINSYDIANDTVIHGLERFSNECRSNCLQPDCHEAYTITTGLPEVGSSRLLKFDVEVPREPSFMVNYHPKVQFIEFSVVLELGSEFLLYI